MVIDNIQKSKVSFDVFEQPSRLHAGAHRLPQDSIFTVLVIFIQQKMNVRKNIRNGRKTLPVKWNLF